MQDFVKIYSVCKSIHTARNELYENDANSMKQNRPWEDKSRAVGQSFTQMLWNLKIYDRIHKILPLYAILSQMNLVPEWRRCSKSVSVIAALLWSIAVTNDKFKKPLDSFSVDSFFLFDLSEVNTNYFSSLRTGLFKWVCC